MVSEKPDVMDWRHVVMGRRSLRRYRSDSIPVSVMEDILQMAVFAPSAHNRQPWRFLVTQAPEVREHLASAMGARLQRDLQADGVALDVITADVARSYDRITSAPALVLVCLTMAEMDVYADERRAHLEWVMAVQSTAMAGQNFLLAAHVHGLGACWMCAPLFCPDVVAEALSLPDDWQPMGLVTLGYPAQEREKTRKPLGEVVIWR